MDTKILGKISARRLEGVLSSIVGVYKGKIRVS